MEAFASRPAGPVQTAVESITNVVPDVPGANSVVETAKEVVEEVAGTVDAVVKTATSIGEQVVGALPDRFKKRKILKDVKKLMIL